MSHTTRISQVRINDAEALRLAVQDLQSKGIKVSFHENAPCRIWGRSVTCPYVVRNDAGRFDVGFEKAEDGVGYTPVFDYHGGELYHVLGQGREIAKSPEDQRLSNIGKLMQAYTLQALQVEAYKQGGMVSFQEAANNSYVMVVR